MENITFSAKDPHHIIQITDYPLATLRELRIVNHKSNWFDRIASSNISFRLSCKHEAEQSETFQVIPIHPFMFLTPYHSDPIIIMRYEIPFKPPSFFNRCISWLLEIDLNNFEFKEGEEVEIQLHLLVRDQATVLQEIISWKQRINKLYRRIKGWIKMKQYYSFQTGRPIKMLEQDMIQHDITPIEVDTANILQDGRIVASLKPSGLWVIGSNGRMDLLTRYGSYLIIDKSEDPEESNWQIYNSDRTAYRPLDEENFFKAISQE